MNISPIISAYGSQISEAANGKSKPAKPLVGPTPAASANVSISNTAREAQMVRDAIAQMPAVRIRMVEEIKARIQNNDYPIEQRNDDTAEKLIVSGIFA